MSGIHVEVVYALAGEQRLVELVLPVGATVADALVRIRPLPGFIDVDIEKASVGIYGSVVSDRNQRLNEGDRVEIYRSLTVDPMTARKLRVNRRAE